MRHVRTSCKDFFGKEKFYLFREEYIEVITTTEKLFRGGQKDFSKAGMVNASELSSRLTVTLTEAVVLPASINQKIKK